MNPEDRDLDKLKVKTACCPICGGWVMQSTFPSCESRPDSIKEFRACAKAGCTIDVVTLREASALTCCLTMGKCGKSKKQAAPDLFTAAA